MSYRFVPILVLTSILCSVAFAQPATGLTATPQQANTQQAAAQNQPQTTSKTPDYSSVVQPDNWVCSLNAAHFDFWRFQVVVTTLSTYRLQNCPSSRMNRVTAASAAAQLRTVASFETIIKGGSHQQIMDINLTPVSTDYVWVSDLKFSVMGTARISLAQLFKTTRLSNTRNLVSANYIPFKLFSETHYIWNTGSLVHRLVSPTGEVYLMTAFTQEVEPSLTRDNLSKLHTMLGLPPGWKFENYFLDRTVVVRAGVDNDNSVQVLFDDLNNLYVQYE